MLLITVGFGLDWFANEMNRFGKTVIEDYKRQAEFLKQHKDSTGQLIINIENLKLEPKNETEVLFKPILIDYA